MEKIRNEHNQRASAGGTVWREHTREDDGYIVRKMLRKELPGKMKWRRPKRRFMDVVREDMAGAEVTE